MLKHFPSTFVVLPFVLSAAVSPLHAADAVQAKSANEFLSSIGACVHVQHHQPAEKLVAGLQYTGMRNVRDGADRNFDVSGLLLLHKEAGVMVDFGPGSGASDADIPKTIAGCEELAKAGALLSIEGPNEPNNFNGVTYQGQNSVKLKSWVPVADFQRDYYQDLKNNAVLKSYPVFGISECGAENDNAGVQFLTIPSGANTLMPDGTKFADYINCHNYVGGHIKGFIDNQATLAAKTKPKAAIDHLFGNHGLTWRKKFTGYTESELDVMPKVTTETGIRTDNTPAGDDRQGKLLLNVYLAQFKAGWRYTFIYEFTDDSDGAFGFYKRDLVTPRKAADYLHNFTSILADAGKNSSPGSVSYSFDNKPDTVHDLLLQKADGTYDLIVWGEQVKGSNQVTVKLGAAHASIDFYDPTVSESPVRTLTNADTVPLTVSDHPLILSFK
jgi:hypothetical protein